ncbi:MAG TPA: serine/threonine-protein kinase [Thermoanaerobaculia bacterium]|nr:serine/threonine-protein kinase [Thermoanaerobaculia bacterium]
MSEAGAGGPGGPLRPGMTLLHYRILERLGAGGMGEVWLAHDERLDRRVALKLPTAALLEDPTTRHRLLREARAAAALEHPAVCRVFELGAEGERHFIVMELVPGETLAARLARGPLPVAQALAWGAAVAAAVEEAHDKGIVHRDLKPANVMITPADTVKVMDFGLARPLGDRAEGMQQLATWTADLTAAAAIVGTPAYMAPEQLKGEPADQQADVWALGCLLFEMLTAARPFSGGTATESMAAVLEREPDWSRLPPETPREVAVLLRRCLRKDRRRRLRHAGDLRLVLEEAGQDDPLMGDDLGASGSDGGRPARLSRRGLLLGSGAAGLLGLGLGAGALLEGRRAPAPNASFQRLTFRRGMIRSARFAPDQQTVLYGALWDGDICRTYTVRPESPESRSLELPPSAPLAVSASAEIALALGTHYRGLYASGTLARVPLAGGVPRELVEEVRFADWSPEGTELAIVRRVAGKDRLEYPIGNALFEATDTELAFPRVAPAGDRVALFDIAHPFGGAVVVVDRGGRVLHRSPEFLELFGLAWRGDEVWFTGGDERRVFRAIHALAPPRPPRLVARLPGNVSLHDVAADGRLLIAHTSDRSEIAALPPGESRERNLSWLDGSHPGDLSRDGRTLLLTETGQGGGRDSSVYLRGTAGEPSVRLGAGRAAALSPDGRWVLALTATLPSPHLDLLPTGPGEPRRIQVPGMVYDAARWLPDGDRLLVGGEREGRGWRLWVQDLSGAPPRPVTPPREGYATWMLAPDGSAVALADGAHGPRIYSVAGGEPAAIAGFGSGDLLLAWIEAGLLVGALYDWTHHGAVTLLDPGSGRRQPWREIVPQDPAGIMNVGRLLVTPDGGSYAYWWHRALSDLYLVDGLV